MASSTLPKKSVDNWEQVRDEWVADVERFIAEVEGWVAKREWWGTLREEKEIEEDGLGTYTVPRLLVHAPFGRFVLDPECRDVHGWSALIQFCVIPSWNSMPIVREDGRDWTLHIEKGADYEPVPWNEENFVRTIQELRKQA